MAKFKRSPQGETEEWQARLGTKALDPLQALDMQDALRAKKKRALIQGVPFILKYKGETVFYRPEDTDKYGFGPCGYLDIKRFTEERV